MAREFGNNPSRLEGLSPRQENLGRLLFETKITAKVRRREVIPEGSFSFYTTERPTSPVDFPVHPGEFALKLHDKDPRAPLSPIYINLRNLPPFLYQEIAGTMAEVSNRNPDLCVGIPKAGTPIAEAYSKITGIPIADILAKDDRSEFRHIEIPDEAKVGLGKSVLLIDDLITQADTKREAIKAAEQLGYVVVGILVLVDREQGGVAQLEREGYNIQSVFKLTQLLNYYSRIGKITQERYNEVINYLRD